MTYQINNPRKNMKVSVYCSSGWLKIISTDGSNDYGKIYFDVAENNDEDRSAYVEIYYGSEYQTVQIRQTSNPPAIKLTDTGKECSYSEGSYSFSYSIENPRESLTLRATANEDWIADVRVSDGQVSFRVLENNHGDRVGKIYLTYGNVEEEFIVDQKYVKPYVNAFAEKTFLIIKAARLF